MGEVLLLKSFSGVPLAFHRCSEIGLAMRNTNHELLLKRGVLGGSVCTICRSGGVGYISSCL